MVSPLVILCLSGALSFCDTETAAGPFVDHFRPEDSRDFNISSSQGSSDENVTESKPIDWEEFAQQMAVMAGAIARIEHKVDCLSKFCGNVPNDTVFCGNVPNDTVSPTEPSRNSCPPGWITFSESCYYIQPSKARLTFDLAREKCKEFGARSDLVSLETKEEFQFLRNYLQEHSSSFTDVDSGWMTSAQRLNFGFYWSATSRPVDMSILERDDDEPRGQDCLSFWPQYDFKIADVYCNGFDRQFICELDQK